jgi:hypothetical protein
VRRRPEVRQDARDRTRAPSAGQELALEPVRRASESDSKILRTPEDTLYADDLDNRAANDDELDGARSSEAWVNWPNRVVITG